nr:hypothetical protein H04M03.10 - Caenorhabditis elegans [Caenorhabditis elegans]
MPRFLFKYQNFRIAAVNYNGLYWLFVIRCNGIALMTIQRYLSIVKSISTITRLIHNLKQWKIFMLYWFSSVLFSIICFSNPEIGFDSPERMILVMDPAYISNTTKILFVFVMVSCMICLVFYGLIVKFIRGNTQSVSKTLQREIRLAFQVFLSLAAQSILLVYLFFSYIFAETGNTAQIVNTRRFFPLAYGTISFIGPFTILIFNKDVLNNVKLLLLAKKLLMVSIVKTTNAVSSSRIN